MEEEISKGKTWESNNLFKYCTKYTGRNKKPKITNKGKSTQSRDVEILTKEIISKGMNVVLQQLVPEDHIESYLSLKEQNEPFNILRRQSCPSLDQQRTLVINGYKYHLLKNKKNKSIYNYMR